jgi:ketosteroid isomerase-like protein
MEPKELAETYFAGWQAQDFDAVRSVLADDATFRGPLGQADSADECVAGLRGMSQMMTGLDVQRRVADGDDVITWFELLTPDAPPAPTANWMHIVDGRIATIRVAFDPRAILGAADDQ